MPTYNRANFLPKAIESVLAQTCKDWELIIVDDGSTDNTKELLGKFVKEDERIKYIYQENAERSAARNNGINHAQGDFICFLDSDDVYHSTHLQNFVELINKHQKKPALYFSGVSMNEYDSTQFVYDENYKTAKEFILLNSLGTPRACVAKSILEKEQFDVKIRIGEDRELWMRIADNATVYFHSKKSFIEIEHDERSILGEKSVYDSLQTLKYILVKHQVNKKLAKRLLSKVYFNIAKYELGLQNRFKTIKYMTKSLLIDLGNKQSKLKLNVLIKLMKGQALLTINKIVQ